MQDELRRKLRDLVPGPEPEEREPDAREDPRARRCRRAPRRSAARPRGARRRHEPGQAQAPRTTRSWRPGRARRPSRSTRARPDAAGRAARSRIAASSPRRGCPRNSSRKRCCAVMVTFDSSSPTHQPPGSWSSRSRSTAGLERRGRASASPTTLTEPPPRRAGRPLTSSRPRHNPRATRAPFGVTLESGWRDGVAPVALEVVSSARRRLTATRSRSSALRCRAAAADRRPPSWPASRCPSTRLRARRPAARSRARAGARPCRVGPRTSPRGSRLTRDQRSSAGPSRSVSSRGHELDELAAADARRARARRSRRRSGTGRARARCRSAAPRSKTQCAGLPSSAASSKGEDRPVEEQVHAHDRRVLELRSRLAEQRGALRRRERDDERVGLDPLAVGEHHGAASASSARARVDADVRARARASAAAGRVAVHRPERRDREHEVARAPLRRAARSAR